MKGLLGVKLGMTQVFDESGVVTPVTIVQAGPCYVTQVKTTDTDGYNAVQVGFGETKEKRLTGGQKGHLGLLKSNKKHPRRKTSDGIPALRHLREFRTKQAESFKVGQELTVEQFAEGDRVDVIWQDQRSWFCWCCQAPWLRRWHKDAWAIRSLACARFDWVNIQRRPCF